MLNKNNNQWRVGNVIDYWDKKGNLLASMVLSDNVDIERANDKLFPVMLDLLKRKLKSSSYFNGS